MSSIPVDIDGRVRGMDPYSALAYTLSVLVQHGRVLDLVAKTQPLPGKSILEAARVFVYHHCSKDEVRLLRVVRDVLTAALPEEPAA